MCKSDAMKSGFLTSRNGPLSASVYVNEGAEKGINFCTLENRLFEELFKFLQACPNFRFSRGYYQKNGAYRPYFPFLLSSIRFILTRFDANIATALCIVNALRP